MAKFIVAQAFHVFEKPPGDPAKTRENRVAFMPGMVLETKDIPQGHTAEAWLAAGHITKATGEAAKATAAD